MTGYDEAAEWLAINAPLWRLVHASTHLRASSYVGGPTEQVVEVTLLDVGNVHEVTLMGEGPTIQQAVHAAIGGLVKVTSSA